MAYRDVRNGPPTNGYASDQHSSSSAGQDGPSFIVEHLATFTVSAQTGLVYPVDGMRRLLQMEKTTGIWTQRMLLRLERQWLVIQDHENGDLVEKFPMPLIRDPNAFVSNDPRDIYNNILIFIVAEDTVHQIPPEMHIFQCIRVAAEEVVEDLKLYMNGKIRTPASDGSPAVRQPAPPAPMPINAAAQPTNGSKELQGMIGARGVLHDDASSITSERYERDVHVLNRCFDDIERFVARLQLAAAAGRELDRRRRSRKSKKKETGDGMLSIRAKLPTETEFVDVLQKFKLSFNLLAKLRSHIHDPNAPELVHFLFSPLSLIVEASQEPGFAPNLPSQVLSPLLTQDAIELLLNCLTSKETELWNSLGNPWLIPRDKWNGYVVQYLPVFSDGWSPDPSFLADDKDPKRSVTNPDSSRFSSDMYYDSDRGGSPQSDFPRRSRSPTGDRDMGRLRSSNHSDISAESAERNADAAARFERHQRQFLAELKARNARTVQVTYPRTANNDKELTVVRGEYLEILDNSRKWWKARNMRGQVGHVPNTIVTPVQEEDWQRHGSSEDLSEDEDGLPVARKNPKGRNPKNGGVPPPPPPMPPAELKSTPSAANTLKRSSTISRSPSQSDMMFEELKEVISQMANNSKLDIRKTPEAYISSNSSPEEVQQWLKAKEFDVVIQKRLKGMNGAEVFALKREQLEKYFGKEEGHRLSSQLTIQRNTSGFKTTRSTELRQALQRARERAEGANKSNGNSKTPETGTNGHTKEKNHFYQSDTDDDEVYAPSGTLRDVIRKQRKKIQGQNS